MRTQSSFLTWLKRALFGLGLLGLGYVCLYFVKISGGYEPGTPLTGYTDQELGEAWNLGDRVRQLSSLIGERNYDKYAALKQSEMLIQNWFENLGYLPQISEYEYDGQTYQNVAVILPGSQENAPIFVVGAHYDTHLGSPGADDGASGLAALMLLAEQLRGQKLKFEVRLVAFVNTLGPFNHSSLMGSYVYANSLKKAQMKVLGMLSLDSLGCYAQSKGSGKGPFYLDLLLPKSQDYVLFLGNLRSRSFTRACLQNFDKVVDFPAQALTLPWFFPHASAGDEWSFLENGYPALAVTDLASLRNLNVSGPHDFIEIIDFPRLARVSFGLSKLVLHLAKFSY